MTSCSHREFEFSEFLVPTANYLRFSFFHLWLSTYIQLHTVIRVYIIYYLLYTMYGYWLYYMVHIRYYNI